MKNCQFLCFLLCTGVKQTQNVEIVKFEIGFVTSIKSQQSGEDLSQIGRKMANFQVLCYVQE